MQKVIPLTEYYIKQTKESWCSIATLIVLPILVPYILYGILCCFITSPNSVKQISFDIQQLPQPQDLSLFDKNKDFYFSYAPDTPRNKQFVDQLLQLNNLNDVNVKAFTSADEAEHYMNFRQMIENSSNYYKNTTFYQEIFCEDLKALYKAVKFEDGNCTLIDFSQNYRSMLQSAYGISEYEIDNYQQLLQDNYSSSIFMHINFYNEDQYETYKDSGIPMNITNEIVYNLTILNQTVIDNPDSLSNQFTNIKMQPYWTGYGQTLINQINQINVKLYGNIDLTVKYKQNQDVEISGISAYIFFEVVLLFSISVELIVATLLASKNQNAKHVILKRLGVSEWQFFWSNFVWVFIWTTISQIVQVIIFRYTGVLPFSYDDILFDFMVWICIGFVITGTACFIATLLGTSSSGPIAVSCLCAFFLIILPGCILVLAFGGKTIFDPTLVPQWGTWLSSILLPPLNIINIFTAMTSTTSANINNQKDMSQYQFKVNPDQVSFKYIFDNDLNHLSRAQYCMDQNSKNTNHYSRSGACMYYAPQYWLFMLVGLIQAFILMPLLSLWFQYTTNSKAHRRLPTWFIFKKEFWNKKKTLKPGKPTIQIENLTIKYKLDKKCQCKKRDKDIRNKALDANVAIKQLNYRQQDGQVAALVGESNAGKTTSLNFIAGEINSINMNSFIKKRAKKLKLQQIPVRENTQNMKQDYLNAQTNEEVLQSINYVGERKAIVMENFDLNNPIDCYFLHPYVGLQPQDFSNVWMNMNCFDNVYFSLIFRTKNQGKQLPNKDECKQIAAELLISVGLIGDDVMRRKAKELSGGMLRRLSLACVLAGDPKILLLDELTAGVDPVVKRAIWNEIQQIRSQQDVTIILSTHDTSEIAEMAQKITIIDKGFTIIEDQSPFDLRAKSESYNVKFYDESGALNYKTSLKVKDQLLQLDYLQDKEVIIDIVSPHSLQILINRKLSSQQLKQLCEKLQQIVQDEKFQDFVMSKSKLDDIYIDAIGFDRQSCANQEEFDKNETKNEEEVKIENKNLQRLKGLLIKSFKVDTENTFPSVVIYGLTITLFAILTWWFCSLFDIVMDLSNKLMIVQNRQNDVAKPCFNGIDNICNDSLLIQERINKCYETRQDSIFAQESATYDYYSGKCSWYNDYLGLDHRWPNYISIGDRRQQLYTSVIDRFSIDRKDGVTDGYCNTSDIINLPMKDYGNFIDNQALPAVYYDYQTAFENSQYDPSSVHTNDTYDPGFVQYILQNEHLFRGSVSQDYSVCMKTCSENEEQATQFCNEPDYYQQCKRDCRNQYNKRNDMDTIYLDPNYEIIDDGSFMNQYYRKQVNGSYVTMDSNINFANFSSILKQVVGPVADVANIHFDKYDVRSNNKQLDGEIQYTIAEPVPIVGVSGNHYRSNQVNVYYSDTPTYTCNGTYQEKQSYASYYIPRAVTPHSSTWMDSAILQVLPDRQRVQLFDIQNTPEVVMTGAIIRKQMFQYADQNDYTPYNFSYSLVSRGMSYINDGEYVSTSPFSISQYALTFQTCEITTSMLIPMMYAGSIISSDIENHVIDLLQFHFIGKTLWLTSNFIYQAGISVFLYLFLIVSDLIFIPDSFLATSQQYYNFGFALLNSVESSITGILLGLLIKNSRQTTLVSFFILLLCMCLAVLSLGNKVFTIIISIFVPSYSLQYEYVQLDGLLPIDSGILVLGICMSVLQVLLSYVVVNWTIIKSWFKRVFNIQNATVKEEEKQINVEKQSLLQYQEQFIQSTTDDNGVSSYNCQTESKFLNTQLKIKDLHMIYDSGTYALKGINVDIPKGFIFGLIGSNGSGKSTTFNLLSGVYKPTKGKALLYTPQGKIDLFQCNNVSQYFSVVPQHDIYWPNLTVQDHLDLMVYFNALDKKADIDQIIKQLQLEQFLDQPMQALSGGVRRRVSIALAMTNAPYILALDEVSCGLGLTVKRFVHEAILRILSKDITLVMTSHDMPEIEELVDCVCLMNNGEVVANGSVSQLRNLCNVTFELSLRQTKSVVNEVANDLLTDSIEYNEYNDVYVLKLKREQKYIDIINVLDKYQLLNSEWNIEAIRMENVFLEIIKQAEENKLESA